MEKVPENRGRWVLAATILGSSMAFIDGTVVNVALPALQGSLRATASEMQWVVEAYALLGRGREAEAERAKAVAINPHALDRNPGMTWLEQ